MPKNEFEDTGQQRARACLLGFPVLPLPTLERLHKNRNVYQSSPPGKTRRTVPLVSGPPKGSAIGKITFKVNHYK